MTRADGILAAIGFACFVRSNYHRKAALPAGALFDWIFLGISAA